MAYLEPQQLHSMVEILVQLLTVAEVAFYLQTATTVPVFIHPRCNDTHIRRRRRRRYSSVHRQQ
jgi:hypothetical protein